MHGRRSTRIGLSLLMFGVAALVAACGSTSSSPKTLMEVLSATGGTAPTTTAAPPSSSTGTPATRPHGKITVRFVGDSVPASIGYVPAAQRELEKGLKVKLDLKVCRRLATMSCPYDGSTPPSALDTIRSYGTLGDVLVVDVGYNDYSGIYREGMQKVIKQANAEGVRGIVWVNMRQAPHTSYDWTDHVITSEAKRWPNVVVADWNDASKGKKWFGPDGLHLNDQGAEHLASFLRPYIYQAALKQS